MKKLLSILLAVVLCFSVCSVVAIADNEDIVVSVKGGTTQRGGTITVPITLDANKGFVTLGIAVNYDADVLEIECPKHEDGKSCTAKRKPTITKKEDFQIAEDYDCSNSGQNSQYHTVNPYLLQWAYGTVEEDICETGEIASITFKVKDDAAFGDTTVEVEVTEASGYGKVKRTFKGASATVTVACTKHTKDAGTVTTKATCDKDGVKTYKCVDCEAVLSTEKIAKLGHYWGSWYATSDAKCGEKGVQTRDCKRDGCNESDTQETAALDHSWDEGEVTTQPTCDKDGVKTFKCTRNGCNGSTTEPVAKLGHKYGDWKVTTEPTCEDKGVETQVCANDASHKVTRPVDALGHDFDYENPVVTKEPTCDKDGVKTFKCTRNGCNGSTTEPVAKLGHKYGDWKVTTEPTCEDKGVETQVCANDASHKVTRPVDALGHDFDYESPVVTKEPTCTEEGEAEYECLNGCGEVETEVIDALGHTIDWEITKEATTEEEGERTGTCDECGETVTEAIPVLTATLEGDKLGIIEIDEETGEITTSPANGFKVESGDDEPFSGYVEGSIVAGTPEGEDANTVNGKTVAIAYAISLTNTDTSETVDMDKLITLTIPVSNDVLAAYENLVLVGVDANGDDVILEGAELVDGAFVVTGKYSELAVLGVAGDKIVVEEEKDDDKDTNDKDEAEKDETTSPATGDTTAIAFVVVMLAIAASVLVFASKKARA